MSIGFVEHDIAQQIWPSSLSQTPKNRWSCSHARLDLLLLEWAVGNRPLHRINQTTKQKNKHYIQNGERQSRPWKHLLRRVARVCTLFYFVRTYCVNIAYQCILPTMDEIRSYHTRNHNTYNRCPLQPRPTVTPQALKIHIIVLLSRQVWMCGGSDAIIV